MSGSATPARKKRRLLVPREEIAWFPKIDASLCNGCGDCDEFCKPGVFALGEPEGVKRAKMTVSNPYNCVVQCNRCQPLCPSGAISLPVTKDFDQFVEFVD
ncbi:MAG: ferredoxin family protein [Chlorobium sp.]|nr:ferredoxin family protein [Chlorobium sp.]